MPVDAFEGRMHQGLVSGSGGQSELHRRRGRSSPISRIGGVLPTTMSAPIASEIPSPAPRPTSYTLSVGSSHRAVKEGSAAVGNAVPSGVMQLLEPFFWLIDALLALYIWAVILWVVLGWLLAFQVVNVNNRLVFLLSDSLYRLVEPAAAPIRRILPRFGGIDFSPIVLVILVYFLRRLVLAIAVAMGVYPAY